MKPTLPLLLAVSAACLALDTVLADDAAVQQLRASQAALAKAPAWRRTTISTGLDTNKARTVVAESVQPNFFRLVLSELQCFSDGKTTRVRDQHGAVSDGDAGMVRLVEFSRAKYGMKGLTEGLKDAHVEEHITFRGLPATVIAFTNESDGMVSRGKLWISNADSLPLKIEYEVHGEVRNESGAGEKIDQRNFGSFEYGPDIKVVMP